MIKQVDVLVIGGGLAGLMAAMSAHEHHAKVLLISKGKIGRGGNTLVSGGGMSGALGSSEDVNNPQAFYSDIIKSGKGLADEQLARLLADSSGEMIERLYGYGVKFIKESDGSFRVRRPPGHSVARNIPTNWDGIAYANRGLSFSLPIHAQCQAKGIEMLEGWALKELLKSGDKICGAAFGNKQNEQLLINAKSVILACGGYGFLFAKTNNTNDALGEGIAAAMRIGCRVRDMEQVQFYPTMMFEPLKITASNPLFGEGATLRNRHGERFMHKYDPDGDMATRDNMARGIFLEVQAGLGVDERVYFDCTGIAEQQLLARFGSFYGFLKKNRIDLTKDYLKVSPCVHYTLGGIVIDERCQTDVAGLYAAGEITGGVHGANRLSGAALMETCVFGWEAGKHAAEHSFTERVSECGSSSSGRETVDYEAFDKLRDIMWQYVSLVRSQESLSKAREALDKLGESSKGLQPFLDVCQAIIGAATLRQESRGAHYRADYPHTDVQLAKPTCCRLDAQGKLEVSWI